MRSYVIAVELNENFSMGEWLYLTVSRVWTS